MMIKIHRLPTSNIPLPPSSIPLSIHSPPLHTPFDTEAISQQSQPSLPAKLIWQVCIKAPDQYPLRAVRAKAKKNNASASPPLPLYQMRKNESWTLFSPLLNRLAVLSPALYQTDTHRNKLSHRHIKAHKWTQTHIYRHTHAAPSFSITRLTSCHWSAAVKLTEGLGGVCVVCVFCDFHWAVYQGTINYTTLIKSRLVVCDRRPKKSIICVQLKWNTVWVWHNLTGCASKKDDRSPKEKRSEEILVYEKEGSTQWTHIEYLTISGS